MSLRPVMRPSLRSAALRRTARPTARCQSTQTPAPELDWPTYLRLRKSARRAGLIASIPTTALGLGLSASQFGNVEADPTATILGLEPIWIYGLAVIGCTGLGWLVGPSVGSYFWRMAHRSVVPSMDVKERLFFQHIKRRRADPSRQSVQNPTPDYYAEKVGSIKDYRQWLRDQAVYRRKAMFGGD